MPEISFSNSKGRDAQVMAESVRLPVKIRWIDPENRQVTSTRVLKGTVAVDLDALLSRFGSLEKVGEAIIAGDPEIDLETCGMFLKDTSRVYVNAAGQVVHRVVEMEIVRNPDGTEKTRRPKKRPAPNVDAEHPLPWTGKMLKKSEVYNKFVLGAKMQIEHINGLTYDFLFNMAKELEEKESLMVVGTGPKGNQPIILRHGGLPYRGFLEGRTRGDEYCLILHLSNMELKLPSPAA